MSSIIYKSQNTKSAKVALGNMSVRTVSKAQKIDIPEVKEPTADEIKELDNIICSNKDLSKNRCELLSGQWLDYWELYYLVILPVIRQHAISQTSSRSITKFNSIHYGVSSVDSITCLNHFINSCQREYPLSKFLWDWFVNPRKHATPSAKQFADLAKDNADKIEYFFNSRISLEDLTSIYNKAKLSFDIDSRGISLYFACAIDQVETMYYLLHSIHVMEDGGSVIIQMPLCQLIEYIYTFGQYFETLKVHKSSMSAHFYIIGDKFLGNFNAKLIANKLNMTTFDTYFTNFAKSPKSFDPDAILKAFTEELVKEELIPSVDYKSEQYQIFAENIETEYDLYSYDRAKFLTEFRSTDKTNYIADKMKQWIKQYNLQPNNPKGILYVLDNMHF